MGSETQKNSEVSYACDPAQHPIPHLSPRDLVDEVLGNAVMSQQGARAEPAQSHFDGCRQAGSEHISRELGVLQHRMVVHHVSGSAQIGRIH